MPERAYRIEPDTDAAKVCDALRAKRAAFVDHVVAVLTYYQLDNIDIAIDAHGRICSFDITAAEAKKRGWIPLHGRGYFPAGHNKADARGWANAQAVMDMTREDITAGFFGQEEITDDGMTYGLCGLVERGGHRYVSVPPSVSAQIEKGGVAPIAGLTEVDPSLLEPAALVAA